MPSKSKGHHWCISTKEVSKCPGLWSQRRPKKTTNSGNNSERRDEEEEEPDNYNPLFEENNNQNTSKAARFQPESSRQGEKGATQDDSSKVSIMDHDNQEHTVQDNKKEGKEPC